jgi:bla regulator protein BlaR1
VSTLFQIVAINALCASILALVAALAGRYLARPSAVHVLWLVVLFQLFMPPVVPIGVLPDLSPDRTPSESVSPVHALDTLERVAHPSTSGEARPATSQAEGTSYRVPSLLAAAIWLVGTSIVLGLVLVRLRRFRRLLRVSAVSDANLSRHLERIAGRMGIRAPRLRCVRAPISPLVWPRPGGVELLFPSELSRRLESDERDAILAHELAHVARRDHWVRIVELIAVSLFWWNPVVWWARARIRAAEERCCDQRVMRVMEDQRSSYARGLLKTVEFLAGTGPRVPVLASGVGEVRDLEDRLTMIMKNRPPEPLSRTQRFALAAGAIAVLLVFPTWSDGGTDAATPDAAAPEAVYRAEALELERQAAELEYALTEVRSRQNELEQLHVRDLRDSELSRLDAEAMRRDSEGAREKAAAIARQAAELRRQVVVELGLAEAAHERDRRLRALELAHESIALSREAALAEGDRERALDLAREAEALEQVLHETIVIEEGESRQAERQLLEVQLDRLRDQALELREAGHPEQAVRIEDEARALRDSVEWELRQQARDNESPDGERRIEALSRRIRELERELDARRSN